MPLWLPLFHLCTTLYASLRRLTFHQGDRHHSLCQQSTLQLEAPCFLDNLGCLAFWLSMMQNIKEVSKLGKQVAKHISGGWVWELFKMCLGCKPISNKTCSNSMRTCLKIKASNTKSTIKRARFNLQPYKNNKQQ